MDVFDINSTILNDLAYKLYLIDQDKFNEYLELIDDDKRVAPMSFKMFLNADSQYTKYINKSNIIIRKDKINKIINGEKWKKI